MIKYFATLGAYLSRWHGGGFFGAPKLLKNLAYALPLSLPFLFLHDKYTMLAVLAYTMATKATGHGRGMSLGLPMKEGSKPEFFEHLVLWLQPYLPVYWYKFTIMGVIGYFRAFGASLALGVIWMPAGIVSLMGGLLLPVAYAYGWFCYPKGASGEGDLDEATEVGEFLGGGFQYLFFAIGVLMVIFHGGI